MQTGQQRRHERLINQIVWLPIEENYRDRAVDDGPPDDSAAMGQTGTYDHQFTQQQHRERAPHPQVSAQPAPPTTLSDLTHIASPPPPPSSGVKFHPGMELRRFNTTYVQDGQTFESPPGQAQCRFGGAFIRFDPNEYRVDELGRLVEYSILNDD
jgi:hypothetical protein